jgi:hypothetical protein
MNKKLVIVWVSVIVVFILIGIYGLSNVDRLVEDGAGGQIFLGSDEHLRKCTYNTQKANITYNFIVGENNKNISRMVITYKTNKADPDRFKFAKSISDAQVTGVSSTSKGQTDNFTLTMNVDMMTYTGEESTISTNLVSMDILLEKIANYDTYILDLSKTYSDDIKNLACS